MDVVIARSILERPHWSCLEVYKVVTSFVESNVVRIDLVMIVCDGRLKGPEQKAIKNLMGWLKFNDNVNKKCFMFIVNKCEKYDAGEREEVMSHVQELLEVQMMYRDIASGSGPPISVSNMLAVGFPPDQVIGKKMTADLKELASSVIMERDAGIVLKAENGCNIL